MRAWRERLTVTDYGLVVGFLLLCAFLAVLSPSFLSATNLLNVARQVAVNALLAAGQTFVILTAGIDLSVGSALALSGAVAAGTMVQHGMAAGILAGLLTGLLVGAFNGLVVTRLGIPDFIVTLAMLSAARGLTLIYTNGLPIGNLPPAFLTIGGGYLGPIPIPVLLMLLVYLVAYLVLRTTAFGRYVYAVGGNRKAAAYAGIPVRRVRLAAYLISGFLAAVAGIVLTSRLATADPQAGTGYELDSIAAVVLGGTSLFGGEGQVLKTLLGALILGVLGNGMNLLNVSPFYQEVVKGIVILLAVALGNLKELRRLLSSGEAG
ncbi:MAG: ABC transporter permease [Bacillota bacterium]|nr:ABC transporter permease [Bacillota bacterium]